MSKTLISKCGIIFGIAIMMFFFQNLILQLIDERANYQASVKAEIVANSSAAQTLLGPLIVIPYRSAKTPDHQVAGYTYLFPSELNVTADNFDVQHLKKGIYTTPVYQGDFIFRGHFNGVTLDQKMEQQGDIIYDAPFLTVALGDTRGIIDFSSVTLGDHKYQFHAGSGHQNIRNGLHIPLDERALSGGEFSFSLSLKGTETLKVIPLGKISQFSMKSDWPHPNFTGVGAISPESRQISKEGFSASWRSTWFANQINTYFEKPAPFDRNLPAFHLTIADTVDHYQLNTRTVKYGILFVGLTFIAFLLYDLMRQLNLHPIQYGLTGTSLLFFYLVLLAFSEKIGFAWAYLFASLACSILIGSYLIAILRSQLIGSIFAGSILALYALLYLIINSEGNALLFGTIFLFILLTIVMIGTRNIDWYALTNRQSSMDRAIDRALNQKK